MGKHTKEYYREYRAKHKKELDLAQKEYREAHKQELAQYKKGWYEGNKERILSERKERWDNDQEYRAEHNEKSKERYRNNKEKILDANKKWAENNREKVNALGRKSYAKNIEKQRKRSKKKYVDNKERELDRAHKWYAENEGRAKQTRKAYKETHRELYRVCSRNRKSQKRGAPGKHTATEWKELCDRYDNRCLRCGEKKPLTEDHIIPVTVKGTNNYIQNLQPLCQGCNSKKGTKTIDYRPLWGNKIMWCNHVED